MNRASPAGRNGWIEGLLIIAGLLALLGAWEFANGHGSGFVELFSRDSLLHTRLFVIVLTGFMWGARRYSVDAFEPDLAALSPQLVASPHERDVIIARFAPRRGPTPVLISLLTMTVGLMVISERGGSRPYLFSDAPWQHDFVAALVLQGLLFWMIGNAAYRTVLTSRLIMALSRLMPPVDLLDLSFFAPFARQGLRMAFLWLGGSSIASLIYLDQDHDLETAMVIAATVSLGIYSLLQPLRGARLAIVEAKRSELVRVREAIRKCRSELLDPTLGDSTQAAARIPGLLAYEARIDAVHDWPLDLPTIVRFALLVALAVGSWLGGAVAEMLLDKVVGG